MIKFDLNLINLMILIEISLLALRGSRIFKSLTRFYLVFNLLFLKITWKIKEI